MSVCRTCLLRLAFVLVPCAAMAGQTAKARQAAFRKEAEPLRSAIADLRETFGPRYPGGRDFLARLARLEARAAGTDHRQTDGLDEQLRALRREALIANPLVSGRPILFVVRRQYANNHGTEATMCQTGEINTKYFRGGGAKPLVSTVGCGPVRVIWPYSWGSRRSRLVDVLRKGHHDVRLDKESFDRIVTWIDLNVPYYPSHVTYYRTHTFGRCPLDHGQLARLGKLILSGPRGKGNAGRASPGRHAGLPAVRGRPAATGLSCLSPENRGPQPPGHPQRRKDLRRPTMSDRTEYARGRPL